MSDDAIFRKNVDHQNRNTFLTLSVMQLTA